MTGPRPQNKPPVRQPFLDDQTVAAADFFVHELGARYSKLATHFGVHKRTLMSAVNRKGAYARVAAYQPKETR